MSGAFIYIAELDRLIDTGSKADQEWFMKVQKKIRTFWEKSVMEGKKDPISLDFYDSEAIGSPCPICGEPPIQKINNVNYRGEYRGEYTSFEMACHCEDNYRISQAKKADLSARIEACRLPEKYINLDWSDWDTGVHQELTESFQRVREMGTGHGLTEFLRKEGLCIYGHNGRGKTMAGVCLLKSILENTTLRCRFIPMADYARSILSAGRDSHKVENDLDSFDVLYLDDMDKISTSSEWVRERVFSLFDRMYREKKTVIISTNLLTIGEIREFFQSHGDAIVSRMTESMVFARFVEGNDYRGSRRANNRETGK